MRITTNQDLSYCETIYPGELPSTYSEIRATSLMGPNEDITADLRMEFNGSVALANRLTDNPNQALYLVPAENSEEALDDYEAFHILLASISISDTMLTGPSNFYFTGSSRSLRWGTQYLVCNLNAITDASGTPLPVDLMNFTTAASPRFFVNNTAFFDNALVIPDLNNTIFSGNRRDGPANEAFTSSSLKRLLYNLTDDVLQLDSSAYTIGVLDTGILPNSEVIAAVKGRALDLDERFFPEGNSLPRNASVPTSVVNHGTNMARYMLNFVPMASLYDFPTQASVHLNDAITRALTRFGVQRRENRKNSWDLHWDEYAQLVTDPNINVSIISHSGGSPIDRDSANKTAAAIANGLVYARGLGNARGSPNTIADRSCERDQNFVPYIIDLRESEGAFVTVQAISYDANFFRNYDKSILNSLRAKAGDAANYTISMWENGNGATSEATATFSAMVSLMLAANERYNQGRFSPRQLVEIMMETADRFPGREDTFGHGLLNMGEALAMVKRGETANYTLYEDVAQSPHFLNMEASGFDFTELDGDDECISIR